jgi:hypothetical protein
MNIYYYLVNLWPMLIVLVLIVLVDGVRKLLQKNSSR